MARNGEIPPLGGRFVKLWAAGTTSALGSGLATIAVPLLIASRTSNPLIVSGAAAAAWLPWLLFALPGGVLVDRVDHRRLMISVDWARVVLVTALAVAILTGHAAIAFIYLVLFAIDTGEVVFRSANQAMVVAVVPRSGLERANGWLTGGTTLMQSMIAGPLAGFLFAVAASIPFFVNAGTYAASALLVGLVAGHYRSSAKPAADLLTGGEGRRDATAPTDATDATDTSEPAAPSAAPSASRPARSARAELAEAFQWLFHQRLLRTMALLIGLLNLTLTAATAVLVLLAKERLHLGSVGYGLLFTSMAVGGILGSAVADRLVRKVTATWTIRIGLLIEAAMHLTLALSHSAALIGFALFAFGVHGALWGIVGNSLRQRLTPPHMQGRVYSTTLFIAAGGNCVGALLGGVVAADFGLAAPYWVGFVVAVLVTAATWHVFDRETVARAYDAPSPSDAEVFSSTAA